jgi:LPS O-antigen subunit length determinant protein (WzzB/FepE family)
VRGYGLAIPEGGGKMGNDMFENLRYLWRNKRWIVAGLLLSAIFGAIYALTAPKVYTAEAILFPKETGMDAGRNLLAGAGLSMNPFQNAALTRLGIFLGSEELAENVIRKDSLLPILFPKRWDKQRKQWKDGAPNMREAVRVLRSNIRAGADARNLYLEVYVSMPEPALAVRVLEGYLRALNEKIRNGARLDAEKNRIFLEEQFNQTSDPLIRDRIQQLMSSQIENLMYMSASAFDMPESPRAPLHPEKPRKAFIMVTSVFIGLVGSILFLLLRRQWRTWRARIRAAL